MNKLNSCAIVVRRYNLGDKNYFINNLKEVDIKILELSWSYAAKRIQNKEIVKDASDINIDQIKIANDRFNSFDKNAQSIFTYLNSDFNPTKLQLREENIERHFRHLLAKKYFQIELPNIIQLEKKRNLPIKEVVLNFVAKNLFLIIIVAAVSYFVAPPVIDRLSPVDVLAERIHEKSKYKFTGAICNDGSTSHSQGRGTCSWHDGVNHYFYKDEYSKSIEQCRIEAINISWIGP